MYNDSDPRFGQQDDIETTSDGSESMYNAVAQIFRTATGHEGTPQQIAQWANGGMSLAAIQQGIYNSDEAKAWGSRNATPTTTPTPTPTPTPGPVGGPTTDTGLGSLFKPFGQSYTAPAQLNLGGPAGISYIPQAPTLTLPQFKPPPAFHYDDFVMPGKDDVYQDPSYQLRRDEGQRGIESSAAAQGRVRTGGTLNDILKYNQGFASSEFGNMVDRKFKQYEENRGNAVDTYSTNYRTQYVDPYTFDVQAAKDMFAPKLTEWGTQAQAGQRQNELNNDQSWQQFLQNYRMFDDDRKYKYGVLSDQERIGLDASTR